MNCLLLLAAAAAAAPSRLADQQALLYQPLPSTSNGTCMAILSGKANRTGEPTPPFPLEASLADARKADFELVVAHEDDEDITWTSEYERFRTVYTKGSGVLPETNNSCYEQLHVQCPEGPTCLKIPNIGWQAETLLHHIIERYDTLASVTFLVHGDVNDQPGTMLRAHKEDLRAGEWLWRDFISTDPNFFHYMKCGQDGPQTTFYDYNETLVDAYRAIFDEEWPDPPPLCGLGFYVAVGRDRVRRRPKAFYENFREWILRPVPKDPDADAAQMDRYEKSIWRCRGIHAERLFMQSFAYR